jgi:hypothetical protein
MAPRRGFLWAIRHTCRRIGLHLEKTWRARDEQRAKLQRWALGPSQVNNDGSLRLSGGSRHCQSPATAGRVRREGISAGGHQGLDGLCVANADVTSNCWLQPLCPIGPRKGCHGPLAVFGRFFTFLEGSSYQVSRPSSAHRPRAFHCNASMSSLVTAKHMFAIARSGTAAWS